MPCNQKGNQVRIWWFGDLIGHGYISKQKWNKRSCCIKKPELMKFKFNQMMHCYKFYTFFRDQSLETELNTKRILIINMHFYLLLTEINWQPTKIENFNRLPTSGRQEPIKWWWTRHLNCTASKRNRNWQPTRQDTKNARTQSYCRRQGTGDCFMDKIDYNDKTDALVNVRKT